MQVGALQEQILSYSYFNKTQNLRKKGCILYYLQPWRYIVMNAK
jgi:hypothetical protein